MFSGAIKYFVSNKAVFTAFFLFALLLLGTGTYFYTTELSNEPYIDENIKSINLHYSAFSQDPSFYQNLEHSPPQESQISSDSIGGLLVNHHLLAKDLTAEAFTKTAKNSSPQTVVILSPDHFSFSSSPLTTSTWNWQTPFGVLEADQASINSLTKQPELVQTNPNIFDEEHGVKNVIAFVKLHFPNASVVPLVVKNGLSTSTIEKLASFLSRSLPDKTLFIGSFDFSHYLPLEPANFHDVYSLKTLYTMSTKNATNVEVDSNSGLELLLATLNSRGFSKFELFSQGNSQNYATIPVLETTSYILGAFEQGSARKSTTKTALLMPYIESSNTSYFQKTSPNFAFEYLERLWFGHDYSYLLHDPKTEIVGNYFFRNFTKLSEPATTLEIGGRTVNIAIMQKCSGKDNVLTICLGKDNKVSTSNSQDLNITLNSLNLNSTQNNSSTMAIGLVVKNSSLQIHLFPLSCKDMKCKLLIGQDRAIMLENIAKLPGLPKNIQQQIIDGKITFSHLQKIWNNHLTLQQILQRLQTITIKG